MRGEFTYLKPVKRIESPDKHIRLLCECSLCGQEVSVRKSHVTTKAQVSCGCHIKLIPKGEDLAGQTIADITFIGYEASSIWRVQYSCGHFGKAEAHIIRKSSTGLCVQCMRKQPKTKRHGLTRTSTHNSWCNMRRRCYKEGNNRYEYYGLNGITVCDRWNPDKGGSFDNFLEDMGECPEGLSLERVDLALGYYKENCIWADDITQANNKSNNILIEHNGEVWSLRRWCERSGLNYKAVFAKFRYQNKPISLLLGVDYKLIQS